MKPLYLQMRGFTAFREPAELDFRSRQLFVITGPTGAGKSSILDAITWALYGQVPRVGRSVRELVSHGERHMAVHFEFEARGRTYRISRRAPGATSTRLERQGADGEWTPMADRATDITEQVTRILGMDYATFTKTIVLPQGAFDAFLRGDARERRSILSNLLDLGIYEEARGIASRRASAARDRADVAEHQLQQLDLASPERIAALEQEQTSLEVRATALQAERTALGELADLGRALREAARVATEATERATAAERDRDQAQAAVAAALQRIEVANTSIENLEQERATLAYDAAAHEQLRWRVQLLRQRDEAQADVARARVEVDEAEGHLATARDAAATAATSAQQREAEAAAAAQGLDRARSTLLAAAADTLHARDAAHTEATVADGEARDAEQRAADAAERARDLETLARTLAEAQTQLDTSRAALQQAQAGVAEAEPRASAAVEARDTAEQQVAERRAALETAQMHDAAAALRAGLQPGDPCPVCGEAITTIPGAGDTTAAIEAAREALTQAEREAQTVRRTAEDAASALAAARTRLDQAAATESGARDRVADHEQTLAGRGVTGDPSAAIAQAQDEATALRGQGAAIREREQAARSRAQACDVSLARVPAEVLDAARPAAASNASDLDAAVREHAAAAERQRGAADAHRRAIDEARRTEQDSATAQRMLDGARERLATAERRLADLGTIEGDVDSVRRDLEQADQQQRRDREIEQALGQARNEAAAAAEARTGAEAHRAREETRAQEQAATAREARAAEEEAMRAFHTRWRAVLGDGEPTLARLRDEMNRHEADRDTVTNRLTEVRMQLTQSKQEAERAEMMAGEIQEQRKTADLAGSLARELQGNHFVAFVQGEAMRVLAGAASERLAQLTGGRYALAADGDTFVVVDHLNGDERRSVRTLSGGETFLASLALALALSEHLPELSGTGGAMSLESLFLDEGFGALDAESLDLAVQGLEALATGQRVIGVISHVDEVAERLPDRVRVEKRGETSAICSD